MSVETSDFGKTADGEEVKLITCTNNNGLVLKMTNYGAIVVAMHTPDRDGKMANINLGFDNLESYLKGHPYFGSTVGRFCNRIANGKFQLNGKEYALATNNDAHHLHGGDKGYDKIVWKYEPFESDAGVGVRFNYMSKDGEEGYPGNLNINVAYVLTNNDELRVEFTATTDQSTPINLTNHNYWNLSGAGSGSILDHELMINSDKVLAVDETLIPTGDLADVKDTPFDFTTPQKIGSRVGDVKGDPAGYDHCFALKGQKGVLGLAAKAKDPKTGRVMEIWTTQPGIQFYTGNFLDGTEGSGGHAQHTAFCLETQHYPDSPNQPKFPSSILNPGTTYSQTTVHKFSAE